VTPAEVLAEGTPGPLALVVDVPGAAYLPALLAHPTLQRCQAPAGEQTANETKTFLSTADAFLQLSQAPAGEQTGNALARLFYKTDVF